MRVHGTASTPPLRVGLVQFKPQKADVARNLSEIRDRWLPGAPDVDLLVFPEACLTGYFLEGGVTDGALSVEEVALGLGRPEGGAPDVVLGFY